MARVMNGARYGHRAQCLQVNGVDACRLHCALAAVTGDDGDAATQSIPNSNEVLGRALWVVEVICAEVVAGLKAGHAAPQVGCECSCPAAIIALDGHVGGAAFDLLQWLGGHGLDKLCANLSEDLDDRLLDSARGLAGAAICAQCGGQSGLFGLYFVSVPPQEGRHDRGGGACLSAGCDGNGAAVSAELGA